MDDSPIFTAGDLTYIITERSGHRPATSASSVLPPWLPCQVFVFARAAATVSITETSASPAATGHQERRIREPVFQESPQHFLHLPTNMGDYLDPRRGDRHLQRPGDSPANQHVRPASRELAGSMRGIRCHQGQLATATFTAIRHLDKEQAGCHIEHRGDPALPVRDRHLHHYSIPQLACHRVRKRDRSLQPFVLTGITSWMGGITGRRPELQSAILGSYIVLHNTTKSPII